MAPNHYDDDLNTEDEEEEEEEEEEEVQPTRKRVKKWKVSSYRSVKSKTRLSGAAELHVF